MNNFFSMNIPIYYMEYTYSKNYRLIWNSDLARRLVFKSCHSSVSKESACSAGDGSPLPCSCLENPRDGEAWWAAVCWVARSQTRLKQLSSSSSSCVRGLRENQCRMGPVRSPQNRCPRRWTLSLNWEVLRGGSDSEWRVWIWISVGIWKKIFIQK